MRLLPKIVLTFVGIGLIVSTESAVPIKQHQCYPLRDEEFSQCRCVVFNYYGNGMSALIDFERDRNAVERVGAPNAYFYIDMCGNTLIQECKNTIVCKEIIHDVYQFYEMIAPLFIDSVSTTLISDFLTDILHIKFNTSEGILTTIRAYCDENAAIPFVKLLDSGQNENSYEFAYYSECACTDKCSTGKVSNVFWYLSEFHLQIAFTPPDFLYRTDTLLGFKVIVRETDSFTPIAEFNIDYNTLDREDNSIVISLDFSTVNIQHCKLYNVSVGTQLSIVTTDEDAEVNYQAITWREAQIYVSHLKLVKVGSFSNRQNGCIVTWYCELSSIVSNAVEITYAFTSSNQSYIKHKFATTVNNVYFARVSQLLPCGETIYYTVTPFNVKNGIWIPLDCSISGYFYINGTAQIRNNTFNAITPSATPSDDNDDDDDDDDGLTTAEKIVITAVVTFVGTILLMLLLLLLIFCIYKLTHRKKKVFVYPLKRKVNTTSLVRMVNNSGKSGDPKLVGSTTSKL